MYSWQHCGTGTLSYRHPRHSVIMDQWNGQQCAFAIKMFYRNNYSLEGAQKKFRRIKFAADFRTISRSCVYFDFPQFLYLLLFWKLRTFILGKGFVSYIIHFPSRRCRWKCVNHKGIYVQTLLLCGQCFVCTYLYACASEQSNTVFLHCNIRYLIFRTQFPITETP
jgi:hypothetical protein